MSQHIYNIPTGKLTLNVKYGNPDDYFRVEARHNPKRGFLFVSKVLGKHIAVDSNRMEEIYVQLAEKTIKSIKTDKKTLVIGMAETATLLGFGVYQKLSNHFIDKSLINYLQSTRYPANNALPFEEAHSHAPSQFIHLTNSDLYEQVILVDDELSTGNTFIGFEKILFENMANLQKISWVCLTDFRKEEIKKTQKNENDVISLLSGEWEFEWSDRPKSLPSTCENINSVKHTDICPLGRYNMINSENLSIPLNVLEQISKISPKGDVLIVGSGEFMPLPYVLLEHIKKNFPVKNAYFQATTRSPALMKGLSWECDHYKEGVKQYIYNYDYLKYDKVIFCIETEKNDVVEQMIEDMKSDIVLWK